MDSDYYSQTQSGPSASQRGLSVLQERPISRTAGTVHKIQMKNFMCHDNLEVTLNPHINFIIGKNGSGKSAIQTAIAVGLGGKAMATNRGSSIKALIKNNKSSCTIYIVLNNQGESAYKAELYGPYIKVERTFSHSTSSYKIKDSNDKLISSERKELDRIVNHFNIQPENPLCILQQDTARSFLNSSDPKTKYAFYMKASRLGEISKLYNDSFMRVQTIKETLDAKFENVAKAFHDVLEMKEKLKVMEDAKEKREKCVQLEKEMIWAEVNESNSELKKLQKQLEAGNDVVQKLEKQLKDLQEKSGEEKIRELESKLSEMDEMVEDARNSLDAASIKHLEKKNSYAQSVGKFREAKDVLRFKKSKYDSCLAEIEKLTQNAPDIQQRQDELKQELTRQAEELNALKAAEATAFHDKQQLNDTEDVSRQNLQDCEQRLTILCQKKRKITDQIRHLNQSTSNLSIYGQAVVSIVEEIERATSQKKFDKKPIGPIGRHISVKDPQWAGAVENFLTKGFLSSFCVDNSKDCATLSKIMKSVCTRYNSHPPPVICSKFLPKVHDISRNETGNRQYISLSRALEIDNPVVANCLIDQMDIETVLLIPTNDEAYEMLDEEHKVPRNCRKAFTLTGDQFVPAPNYKTYSSLKKVNRASLLHANQQDVIRDLSEEVNRLSQEIGQVEKQKQTMQKQLGEICNSLNKNDQELRNIKKRRFNIERRLRQIDEEINESENQMNIRFLEEEAQELKTQYESELEKFEGLKGECERCKKELEEAKTLHEQYRSTIEESNRRKAPVQIEIQRLRSIMKEASNKRDLINMRINDQRNKIRKIESKIQEVERELASARENATQSCEEEVETDRSKEEIEKELKGVKIYLRSLEETLGGSVEVLQKNLMTRQKEFDEVTKNLNDLRTFVKNYVEGLNLRRRKLGVLQYIMMNTAKHSFQIALKERNFEGKLEFDTKAETLNIKVSRPQHNELGQAQKRLDTSSLSGGEKSYSTVCFIMALWNDIELPFHFMDEFDVFMDGVNRRAVIDMLITHALNIDQQFVFLTPLETSSIKPNEKITIHRLAAPRQ